MKQDAIASVPAVEFRGVCKRFGERVVLDAVDLTIARGEFFALLGPSGSGKSTLLKMTSGIDVPDQGAVWLSGRDVTRVPPYRRPVHTVFQNYALFPHLDVAGNVAFPLKVAGVPSAERLKRVQRALGWVQMEKLASRRIEGLSGGERQRVALARALVDDPECVLLDEPLSALDPHLRGHTLELLQDLQSRLKATYLYVTHDREEALRAAHRIGVLNHGHLQQVGTPEDLYRRPATPFVASFVGPISWLHGVLSRTAIRLVTGQEIPTIPTNIADGQRVQLGIRPEDIRIGDSGFLQARVTQRQFAGATVSLRLQSEDGTTLAAEVPADRHPPAAGESVNIGWSVEAGHLFEDES